MKKIKQVIGIMMCLFLMMALYCQRAEAEDTNEIEYNQYYEANILAEYIREVGSYKYSMNVEFPENGRARILLSNCIKTPAEWWWHDNMVGDYRYWKEKGIEEYNSGWITVNSGKYEFSFESGHEMLNSEAEVMIEYQNIRQYNGEVEENDTFETASFIKNNITYEGNFKGELGFDTDIYKFYVSNPALVEIKINDESRGHYSIYEEEKYGNVSKMDIGERARLAAGYYYIEVWPGEMENGEYTIRVNATYESPDKYEQENNNVRSQANKKQINCWYTGNLNNKNDVDCYQITLPQKGNVFLELKVPRQAYEEEAEISLCDKNGSVLESAKNTGNPYLETEPVTRNGGTYYVYVKSAYYGPFTGDYSFRLHFEPVIRNKIVYRLNNGKNNPGNPSVYTGNTLTLKAPSRKGYIFKGWFTNKGYQKQIKRITKKSDKEIVVYAKWEKVQVERPIIISAKRKNNGQTVVKMKGIKDVRGYEVTYSTDKKYKKNCKTVNTKKKTIIIKKMEKGKNYYVKIRAYKMDSTGQKVYSKYSLTKKVS